MAIKTFTSGEVLTAADTNTYLANSGLTYISTTTLTASGQNIAGVFTSAYTNYFIMCNDIDCSATNTIFGFRLGSSTVRTDYKYAGLNILTSSGVSSSDFSASATIAFLGYSKGSPGGQTNYSFTLTNPQVAKQKNWGSMWGNGQYNGQVSGIDNLSSAQTDINFVVSSGSITAGTVTIYGYRKA